MVKPMRREMPAILRMFPDLPDWPQLPRTALLAFWANGEAM